MGRIAPYGSWKSPIGAELVAAKSSPVKEVLCDGEDVYWTEQRPRDGGRTALVKKSGAGAPADVLPATFDVASRFNEYGGGDFSVRAGRVVFAHRPDQRLYLAEPGSRSEAEPSDESGARRKAEGPTEGESSPRAITPEGPFRYADCAWDPDRNRVICLREDHGGPGEAVQTIVSVPLDGGDRKVSVLLAGSDFYFSPRIHPDGTRLVWLTWSHPRMPWDGTELWVANLGADGAVGTPERVAGGAEESVCSPAWSPDGVLHFASDRSGFWNLYRHLEGRNAPLHPRAAEFALAPWQSNATLYDFLSSDRIVCAFDVGGSRRLAVLDTRTGLLQEVAIPYSQVSEVRATGTDRHAALRAGSPTESWSVVHVDVATGRTEVLARSAELPVEPAYVSIPRAIEFPTGAGRSAHAFLYPPANPDFEGPEESRPPLICMSHGGPTSNTVDVLKLEIQYFTSRGFAVVDVNYGGSTGYGRQYRERLRGRWGIVDVEDCVNAARHLAAEGIVDGERMAIRGSSAGGYTTLCALVFHDVFKAGASLYGIGDLEALAGDTHKFESRYVDSLVGPYPERRDLYRARSPIHFVDRLDAPVIFFQGLDDKVVPPAQAEAMVEALRSKGLPVAYLTYEGEAHGFRKGENKRRTLEAEIYFYSRVFGFELADPVEPVPIENATSVGARPGSR